MPFAKFLEDKIPSHMEWGGVKVSNGSLGQTDAPPFHLKLGWITIHFTVGSDGSPWVKWMPVSVINLQVVISGWWQKSHLFQPGVRQIPLSHRGAIFCHQPHLFHFDDRNSSVISVWWQKFLGHFSLMTEIPGLFKYFYGWQCVIFQNLWYVWRNLQFCAIHHFCSQQEV